MSKRQRMALAARMILPMADGVESEDSCPAVQVRRSEQRSSPDGTDMAALLDSLPEHFWAMDLNRRLVSINQVAREYLLKVYGAALEPGMFLLDIFPAEHAALWRERLEQALQQGQLQFEWETQARHIFDFHLHRRTENGKVVGLSCYGREVTAQKEIEARLVTAQKELRRSDALYRIVFDNTPDAIALTCLDDACYVDCNLAFFTLLGYTREEVIGRNFWDLKIWADEAVCRAFLEEIHVTGECRNLVTRFRTKDGRQTWGEVSASRIDIDGMACVLSVTRDVTAAKQTESLLGAAAKKLHTSEVRYKAVFRSSSDGILILRSDTHQILDANPRFSEMLGYRREELVNRTPLEVGLWADLQERKRWLHLLEKKSHCRDFQTRFVKKDGQILWMMLSASRIEIDRQACTIVIVRDVSAAKAAEDEIRMLAFFDPLTGLPNRRRLLDQLEKTLASDLHPQSLCALLFVDLDDFKMLNDTLGHQTGDLLLREVARRITATVRESDLVARLGGDEFVVMLDRLNDDPQTAAVQARLVAEKILAVIRQPYQIDGRECLSTSSIGVTVFDSREVNIAELMQQADIAMYEAKAMGRNTVCVFARSLQVAVNARATIEEELRHGLRNDEFELFYQPQILSGRLWGAESLVRWRHPHHGLLLPGEFIRIAENSGLILSLGEKVLEMACRQIALWAAHPQAAEMIVAVNISPLQLRQDDFVESVLQVLRKTGADPSRLNLELTESMLVDSMEKVVVKMSRLKEHGIHFSIDDFGTGYSSLAYLKRLPLDQLKIDRSFVRDLLEDKTSGVIAQTIISLSRAMGLSVVAEGVENEQQCEYLRQIGCDCLQGFFFGRPLPVDEFEKRWFSGAEGAQCLLAAVE